MLREHNRHYGVTNSADYSPEYVKSRKDRRVAEGQRELKASRIQDIKQAIQQHSH